jgi:hypothetical protein
MGMLLVAMGVLAAVAAVVYRRISTTDRFAGLDDDLAATPLALTPIDSALRDGPVAIGGVVRELPGERDIRAIDDARVVWLEILVEVGTVKPDHHTVTTYTPVLFLVDAVPFALEDTTGRAVVIPSGGRLAQGASSKARRRADGEVARWLLDLLVAQNKAVDEHALLFYAEARICPGDHVSVRGTVRPEGPPEPYRASGRPVVTLRSGAEPLVVARFLG